MFDRATSYTMSCGPDLVVTATAGSSPTGTGWTRQSRCIGSATASALANDAATDADSRPWRPASRIAVGRWQAVAASRAWQTPRLPTFCVDGFVRICCCRRIAYSTESVASMRGRAERAEVESPVARPDDRSDRRVRQIEVAERVGATGSAASIRMSAPETSSVKLSSPASAESSQHRSALVGLFKVNGTLGTGHGGQCRLATVQPPGGSNLRKSAQGRRAGRPAHRTPCLRRRAPAPTPKADTCQRWNQYPVREHRRRLAGPT